MLKKLPYNVPLELLADAAHVALTTEFRVPINEPTGNFFYDPWKIKKEYEGTVWADILATLPISVGEARIIVLDPTKCYQAHADIDDRYHLNINGEQCYLIDLANKTLHKIEQDGIWYDMDAGRLHSAANMGRTFRIQLVIRKLLVQCMLTDPVKVKLTSSGLSKDDARFLFDQNVSTWLNYANKRNIIANFKFASNEVSFDIERSYIAELESQLITEFKLEIIE